MDTLPPLRDVIRRYGLAARKSLGQNFLLDLNLTAKIARAAGPLEGVTAVEIGPGPGGLTRALLVAGAKHVVAIERDSRCIEALGEIATAFPDRLTVIEGDALDTDASRYINGQARVIANLPYNIATPLLIAWLRLEPWPPWFDSLVLMFQREVAERLVAQPGTKNYGRLAVITQWRMEPRIVFDIPPSAFVPQPNVVSSVVRLVPRAQPLPCAMQTLERVTQAAFGQRRKMLRQSLRTLGVDPMPLLEFACIDPTARAEDIPVAGFVALAQRIADPQISSRSERTNSDNPT